jgi:hypothetical protein
MSRRESPSARFSSIRGVEGVLERAKFENVVLPQQHIMKRRKHDMREPERYTCKLDRPTRQSPF